MKRNRKRHISSREKATQAQKRRKNFLIVIMCIALVCVGYIAADASMIRHSRDFDTNAVQNQTQSEGETEKTGGSKRIKAIGMPSIALDNSVMLSSVINDAQTGGYSAVAFELKRADGTIGYTSSLTAVDTFGAVSVPAKQLHESVNALEEKGITPVARICCLADNIVPSKSAEMAVIKDNAVYADSKGNTYLNPDSEAAVKYLRDIVAESYNLGVRVFVLGSTSLPDEIKEGYSDGFENISAKLKSAAGEDAVFLEEVKASVNGWDDEDGEYNSAGVKNDLKKLSEKSDGKVLAITVSKEAGDISDELSAQSFNYILID